MPLHSIDNPAVLGVSVVLFSIITGTLWAAQTQRGSTVTLIVHEGQSLRQIAEQYLGDPDLWQEILRASDLESPAQVKPGVTLHIPRTQIALATDALNQALAQIQKATKVGARVLAADIIRHAIELNDEALTQRKASHWERVVVLARQAQIEAEKALAKSLALRDVATQAILSSRSGQVQSQKPLEPRWTSIDVGTTLVEKEKVRTLSKSHAEVLFTDESQLRLGPNSLALIQRVRVDLLNNRPQSEVSLVEGDLFALLGSAPEAQTLDIQVPGVSGQKGSSDFWVSHKNNTTKIANYDDQAMEVNAEGNRITLQQQQGAVVTGDQAPSAPKALLATPKLLAPEDGQNVPSQQVLLRWEQVPDASHYWVEVASDTTFRDQLLHQRRLSVPEERLTHLDEGNYYWRVSTVDSTGFPSGWSRPRRFLVRHDTTAPYVVIAAPEQGAVVRTQDVVIQGTVERGVKLTLNAQPVRIAADGRFDTTLPLQPGLNRLQFEVFDAASNVTSRERSVIYMPDEAAFISYDGALARLDTKHFLTASREFSLRGWTNSEARVDVESLINTFTARTYASPTGEFQLPLRVSGAQEPFRLQVTSPSGYVTKDRFLVSRDTAPPALRVTKDLPPVTRQAHWQLNGQIAGATRLTFNGNPVVFKEQNFALSWDLQPGVNTLELIAEDPVGNTSRWQRTMVLDRDPPKLLDHAVSISPAGQSVEVLARAEDVSGIKRTARFSLVAGRWAHTGDLVLESTSGVYRGVVTLPRKAGRKVTLQSVTLEDYLGNRRTYRLQ
jgi:hypothetical protein